jgi:hypothetical protein
LQAPQNVLAAGLFSAAQPFSNHLNLSPTAALAPDRRLQDSTMAQHQESVHTTHRLEVSDDMNHKGPCCIKRL